jgi:hypothetical protein
VEVVTISEPPWVPVTFTSHLTVYDRSPELGRKF